MKISSYNYAEGVYQSILSNPTNASIYIRKFIRLLSQSRRMKLLPNILRHISNLENKNVLHVYTSPRINKLINIDVIINKFFLSISNPQIIHHQDEAIIGGFTISSNDIEYNATVNNKLEKIKGVK